MPNNIVKSFAKQSGKSTKEVEKLWKEAKGIASKEYPKVQKDSDKYFKIVTGILKKMLKLYNVKESTDSGDIPDTPGVSNMMGRKCFTCNDETFWNLHQNVKEPRKWMKKFYKDENIINYVKANPKGTFYIKHDSLGLIRKIKL